MGLLDDAIREHLELKRSQGADPVDLARQEREALGPAVREPVAGAGEAETAVAEAPPEDDAPVADAPAAIDQPTEIAPPPEPEPAPEPRADTNDDPPAARAAGQETVAFDADDLWADDAPARAAEGAGEPAPEGDAADGDAEEDVLEETPEFLQETPDHDRMWFEQKPPRDFDFDD
jgi:hypothetical protein